MQIQEIESLVDSEGDGIYRFCLNLTKDRDQADELYQQTFLKAMEVIGKIDKYNNPKSFLISISIGIWKNLNRKKGRQGRIAPMINADDNISFIKDEDIDIEGEVIKAELIDTLNGIIVNLKDKFKLPIIMHYNGELSIEEIATILKVPSGTVKSRLYKGRELIKKGLEVSGYAGWQ